MSEIRAGLEDPRAQGPDEYRDNAREFLTVLSRRKLAVLVPALATPFVALVFSLLQQPQYAASADVLISTGGAAAALSDVPGLSSSDEPERNAETQVGLARLPRVAERVIEVADLAEAPADFLARSSVSKRTNADILRFSVRDGVEEQARLLATEYARQFTEYRNALELEAIRRTRTALAAQLAKLLAAGKQRSALYADLRRSDERLAAAEAVQGSAAIVVQPAVDVEQVAPQTVRTVVLGLALGLLLGIGLAFLVDSLDTRVRSADEAEEILDLPLLGELPTPVDPTERGTAVVATSSVGVYAEAVRKLRANLEFTNLSDGIRSVMITSAVGREGKSTTAASLAVALARAGRKIALVDLDPRAPAVARVFGLEGRYGLADVAVGEFGLENALFPVISDSEANTLRWPMRRITTSDGREVTVYDPLTPEPTADTPENGGEGRVKGHLDVLPFGRRTPPNPGDFVGSRAVRAIIAELVESHDLVIVDTPPLLPVSDPLSISEYVDALLLVGRLDVMRRPMLRSVRRLIATSPARALGLVVTGAAPREAYGDYYLYRRTVEAETAPEPTPKPLRPSQPRAQARRK